LKNIQVQKVSLQRVDYGIAACPCRCPGCYIRRLSRVYVCVCLWRSCCKIYL